jgi:hypothetical protein
VGFAAFIIYLEDCLTLIESTYALQYS